MSLPNRYKVIFFQQFTEGLCNYEGNVLENLGDIETASKCQFACQIYNLDNLDFPCNYFVHNNREQNCQFLSSTDRKCDVIRGPPTPSLDNCPEQPSTEWNRINLLWQLCAAMMSWVGCLLKDSDLYSLICRKQPNPSQKFCYSHSLNFHISGSTYSVSKQPTKLINQLNSSLWHIIVTYIPCIYI